MDTLKSEDLECLILYLKEQPNLPIPVSQLLRKLEFALRPPCQEEETETISSQGHPELRYPTPSSPPPPQFPQASGGSSILWPSTPDPRPQRAETPESDLIASEVMTSSGRIVSSEVPSEHCFSGPVLGSSSSTVAERQSLPGDLVLRKEDQNGRAPPVETFSDNSFGSPDCYGADGKTDAKGKGGKGGKGKGKQVKESLLGQAPGHGRALRQRKGEGKSSAEGGAPNPAHRGDCEKSRGAKALPPKRKSANKTADPVLKEQIFLKLGEQQPGEPVPEDPPLSVEAHHFVLELALICHQFLHGKESSHSPLQRIVQLLQFSNSWLNERAVQQHLDSAFCSDSLDSLAMRCSLAEQNITANSFCFMLNTIQLRCEVIKECHRRAQDKAAVLNKMNKDHSVKTLTQYVLDGAKFTLLAGGGTIFILAFASAATLQSKIRALTHDTIYRIYILLRCPNPNHVLGKLVIREVIPAINELQRRCRVSFSSLFNIPLLMREGVMGDVEAGDVTRSDEFFDGITYNVFFKPRHQNLWSACLLGEGIPKTETAFHVVNRAILAANTLSLQIPSVISPQSTMGADPPDSPLTPMDEGSDSEIEQEASPLPTPMFTINTNYDPNHEDNLQTDFNKKDDETFRIKYTEKERLLAEQADEPLSLEELEDKLRTQLENGVKPEGSYVKISEECLRNMRLRIKDKDGNTVLVALGDLPEEKRSRLLTLLNAVFPTMMCYTDSEKDGPQFTYSAGHFQFWNVYATHGDQYADDVEPAESLKNKKSQKGKTNTSTCIPRASKEIRQYSEEYRLLQECFDDIFDWIKNALKEIFPEDFEIIGQYASVLPAGGFSPVYPFSGFVVNFNVCTRIHRDSRDLRLCVVIALTDENCVGGDLCIKELGIRLPMRCGDAAVFPSHRLSHFNSHFKGERASLVFHTDCHGQVWFQEYNKWDRNVFLNIERGLI